jgi:branched-chain amino acid transport system substrate-binding protein
MLQHSPGIVRSTLIASAAMMALSAHAQTTVKVGLLSTLSGPGASLGVDIRDGFELAVKLSAGKLGGSPYIWHRYIEV